MDGQMFSFFLQERLTSQEDDVFDRRVSKALNLQKRKDGKGYFLGYKNKNQV